jgi:hypothetical protein
MKRCLRAAALALAIFASPPVIAADCPLDLGHGTGLVVFSQRLMVALRPEPLQIEVGQPFSLIMNVCSKRGESAELLSLDATMPAHKHGMNYAAKIVPGVNGRYRVEGLVFHMPGEWELVFDVRFGGETERLAHGLVVR